MAKKTLADRLLKHPDTVVIPLAGLDMPWFLGKVTFDLAKTRGMEFGDVLGQFDDLEEGADLSPLFDAFGQLLYFGMLPFDASLEQGDVTDVLSVGDLHRIFPMLSGAMGQAQEDAQGKAQARAQSKADRAKR